MPPMASNPMEHLFAYWWGLKVIMVDSGLADGGTIATEPARRLSSEGFALRMAAENWRQAMTHIAHHASAFTLRGRS